MARPIGDPILPPPGPGQAPPPPPIPATKKPAPVVKPPRGDDGKTERKV